MTGTQLLFLSMEYSFSYRLMPLLNYDCMILLYRKLEMYIKISHFELLKNEDDLNFFCKIKGKLDFL